MYLIDDLDTLIGERLQDILNVPLIQAFVLVEGLTDLIVGERTLLLPLIDEAPHLFGLFNRFHRHLHLTPFVRLPRPPITQFLYQFA